MRRKGQLSGSLALPRDEREGDENFGGGVPNEKSWEANTSQLFSILG